MIWEAAGSNLCHWPGKPGNDRVPRLLGKPSAMTAAPEVQNMLCKKLYVYVYIHILQLQSNSEIRIKSFLEKKACDTSRAIKLEAALAWNFFRECP